MDRHESGPRGVESQEKYPTLSFGPERQQAIANADVPRLEEYRDNLAEIVDEMEKTKGASQ